jgi:hypothetical protein
MHLSIRARTHVRPTEYPLPDRLTSTTIDALRKTLAQVEEQAGLAPDDVCLIELKRILLKRIVDLESAEHGANSPSTDFLTGNSPRDRSAIAAGLNVRGLPADQPAVAVAVDLAITLLTGYLADRPLESVEAVGPAANGSRSRISNH